MPRHPIRAGQRTTRILAGLAALSILLALVVAVPLVLLLAWRYLGPPIPTLRELAGPDDGTVFVRVLCLLGWAGWVTFTWSVIAEILAQARGWRLPTWGWQQRVAAALIAAITMMLAPPAITSATAAPAARVVAAAPAQATPPPAAAAPEIATPGPSAAATGFIEHRVQPGEQMPALAQRYLGDRYQWRVIAAATYGIPQPDGRVLRPGDTRMYPGQIARIPITALRHHPTASETTTDRQATTVYRASHNDWVWHIADRFLGDPQRYTDIAALNPHLADKYGGRFPDHIEPGDELRLPDDAHDRGPRTHATGTVPTPPPPAPATPNSPDTPGSPGTPPGGAPPTPPPAPAPPSSPPPATSSPAPSRSPTGSATPTPTGGAAAATPGTTGQPPRTPTGAANTPSPPVTTPGSDDASPTSAAPPVSPHTGIDLADHGWVTVEVATAVAAAAALVWIHRRRRYRPQPPGPAHRDDPDLAPLPHTVAALHSARRTTATEDDMDEAATHRPDPAALVTTATLGSHTDKPLHPRDLPASGVGLTGPGAPAAARGLLASVLSAGGPWSPGAQATLITTADDLAGILPGAADRAADLERLHVADTVTAALDELERQLLRRARLASDLDDLTPDSEHADDVLAPAVFLTTAPAASLGTRLTAILTVGARLGVVAVLLGTWPAGQTWQVHTDGTTTVDGQPHGGGPRLNVLDDAAALDILDTVRQVHPTTDDLPPAPPRAATTTVAPAHNAAGEQAPPPTHQQPAATPPPRGAASVPSRRRRLHLTVLGKPIIALVNGARRTELRIRRSAGMQILIYLAVNPNGATSDELMTVLWPAIRPRYARGSFHTTISELRHHLAEAISGDQPDEQPGVEPIPRTDERYHLDTRHVDVDLWAFNATVDQAATAVQPGEHAAALRKIISLYTGAVADGHSWLWLAPYRETTRRHVLDAYVALADTEPEPRQALVLIQDAIRLEPYNEDLYQRAIRLHARLGSPNGVRRTLHTLSERLAELEIPVSAQTQQVATDVLQRLDLRQRATNSTF